MPGGAALVGLVHGDVQASEPDRVARGGEPPRVAELGQDRHRGQLTHAELRQQRPAARLVTHEGPQALVHRSELDVQRVDHRQRDRDLLARRGGQILCGQPLRPARVSSSPR